MEPAPQTPGQGAPVERFHPTSGQVVGYASLAAIVVILVYLAVAAQTVNGLRVGTGLVFFGVLVWAVLLRPRAIAYPAVLHIQNSVRDVLIPYTAIDDVAIGRVLAVRVGDRSHVCTGIGRPRRRRGSARAAMLHGEGPEAEDPSITQQNSYADFVQGRITSLADEAKARAASGEAGTPDDRPRYVWAWLELVGLVVTGAAFALTLFVL
jgi:hypothetical protein